MAVWTLLEPNVPMHSPLREQKLPPMLNMKTTNLQNEYYPSHVWIGVISVYGAVIEYKILMTCETSVENKVVEIVENAEQYRLLPSIIQYLGMEFFNGYVGDADERFIRYLMNCCRRYYKGPSVYASAYVTVVQSSGFGKSRLLFNAATKISEKRFQDDSFDARLMYVCAGETEDSTGFPLATPALSCLFFETIDIAERLLIAVDYACEQWQSVQTDWLKMFDVDMVNYNDKTRMSADWALAIALRKRIPATRVIAAAPLIDALVAGQTPVSLKKDDQDQSVKFILAIDKAKNMLENMNYYGIN